MNTIKLEKRGCDFFKYDNDVKKSDVGNYRVCTTEYLQAKDGRAYFMEFSSCRTCRARKTHKVTGKPLKHTHIDTLNECGLYLSTQFENEKGCFENVNLDSEIYNKALDYTQENILKVIEYITGVKYDAIEFVN